jgi:hypothetical protein
MQGVALTYVEVAMNLISSLAHIWMMSFRNDGILVVTHEEAGQICLDFSKIWL